MTRRAVDVVILGAGTAGLNAYWAARARGVRAVLVDPGPLGTTCARVGCMPSKMLIAAAEAAHAARTADAFGVQAGPVTVDRTAVLTRLRGLRDRYVTGNVRAIEKLEASGDFIRATGRITAPHLVVAGDTELETRAVVVATGSRPWLPPPARGLGDRVFTTDALFELPTLPARLLVVGAGAIGMELGQALHRLGVQTTIVDVLPGVAGIADPDVAEAARTVFTGELDLRLESSLAGITETETGLQVALDGALGAQTLEVDAVLVVTGRRPHLDGFGLENIAPPGTPIDPRTGQLGDTHAFVAGDATGDRMLMHEAGHEGHIAGTNAARWPAVDTEERMAPLAIVFTDPQIATVGAHIDALDPAHTVIEALDFARQKRAEMRDRGQGRMRLYAERGTGRLLGATVFGPEAEHLGHLLAWSVQQRLTVDDMLGLPFYHPVLEEGVRSVLRRLSRRVAERRAS